MWATINTSPVFASVATQVTSPSASNFGANARPSSTDSVEPRGAKVDCSAKETSRDPPSGPILTFALRTRCKQGANVKSTPLGSAVSPAHHGDETHLLVRVLPE